MKRPAYLFIGLAALVGCNDGAGTAERAGQNTPAVSTDTQADLWHAHRHVHDQVQVHDHDHGDGFVGGHEHSHGHAHRHPETALGGIVVSLQRIATAGQLPGGNPAVPPRPHLEILPGLPTELNACLLSENWISEGSADGAPAFDQPIQTKNPTDSPLSSALASPETSGSWSYWSPENPEIAIHFQAEGKKYAITCKKRSETTRSAGNTRLTVFSARLPEDLRERLVGSNARLRLAKLIVQVGGARFRIREQVYFQGKELSVFVQ